MTDTYSNWLVQWFGRLPPIENLSTAKTAVRERERERGEDSSQRQPMMQQEEKRLGFVEVMFTERLDPDRALPSHRTVEISSCFYLNLTYPCQSKLTTSPYPTPPPIKTEMAP